MTLAQTIRRARDLDSIIKESSDELKQLKATILAAGEGEHEGADGSKAIVIFPAPSIKPTADGLRECKRLLTTTQWAKLFVEESSWTPTKAFREVAAALVKPDVLLDLLVACEREGTPQVRLS